MKKIKEKPCCGSCAYFVDEVDSGAGWCERCRVVSHCSTGSTCRGYKRRK